MGLSTETAMGFYHACESGKGWSGCAEFCHPGAGFSAQAGALAEMKTLEEYCDWMAGVLTIMPDASYDLKAVGTDEANDKVTIFGVFHGTHTADGGPVPPTGKRPNPTMSTWPTCATAKSPMSPKSGTTDGRLTSSAGRRRYSSF